MRNNLESIEKCEDYLNDKLSQSQKEKFENELESNQELKDLTNNIDALQKAVFRTKLRSVIEKNAGGGNGFGKAIILGGGFIIIGVLVWFLLNKSVDDSISAKSFIDLLQSESSFDTGKNENYPSKDTLSILKSEHMESSENDLFVGGHELWTHPDFQTFKFYSDKGATIEGDNGTLIIVPENAFIDSTGKLMSGKVEFKLLESMGLTEMVLYDLKTVSNGSPLESGGMFYLEAFVDGKKAQINPNRPLYIEIPTLNKKEGMMAFEGEVDKDGTINWVNPIPLQKFLVKVSLNDLDFLPSGFAKEVQGNMPFLNYKEASKFVIDSLYYSLTRSDRISNKVEEERVPIYDESIRKNSMSIREDNSQDIRYFESDSISPVQKDQPSFLCGIHPTAIETIKMTKFANSFIATKEFEERISYLHKSESGNRLLQIYVNRLNKDLHISDALVAKEIEGQWREKFEGFSNEKLSNIKNVGIYQKRLSAYYYKKQREVNSQKKKLAKNLSSKNEEELNEILVELSKNIAGEKNEFASSISVPSAATSPVYATTWSRMGWGIDKYSKLLANGSVEIQIVVSNAQVNTDVTQWLGDINVYTDLNKIKGQYCANHF